MGEFVSSYATTPSFLVNFFEMLLVNKPSESESEYGYLINNGK